MVVGTRHTYDDAAFFAAMANFQAAARGFEKYRLWTDHEIGPSTQFDSTGAEVWYGAAPEYYVRIVDIPDKLSGDILRYKCDIPQYDCNLEIIGDDVYEIEYKPKPAEEPSREIEEDAKELFHTLPLIVYDKTQHFAKPAHTRREIEVLLKCRGSPHIIELLGRTEDGRLVYPRYPEGNFLLTVYRNFSIANIKRWMLGIVDAIETIHAAGYTYRGFCTTDLLGDDPVVLTNLGCRYAKQMAPVRWMAPELLAKDNTEDADYTVATDIYGLGFILKLICHTNNPRSPYVDWPMIPPFDGIYDACTQANPADRPSLAEVKAMLEDI
ncbi:hypothetical protein CERSUDRAFT_82272 [Gelatoporia subvermispora B]|uniref:Protein kinase domain-containing protein n=1 Tax=Ceriporiopsis subvermispora (strain B) TaxID=914234 RepID=M2QLY6_CERS8|nr:hypothetical protein CERSUDRAFT_82272 [Gelatoporia subvermispora B]